MRYLGLDLGSKTLGIAISDTTKTIASTYDTIRHNEEYDKLIDIVGEVVDKNNIELVVLGFPKNMNNSIGEKGKLSISFKESLEKKLKVPVELEDERLTTALVENVLIKDNVSRKKRKQVVDKVAATVILQGYLDRKGRQNEVR